MKDTGISQDVSRFRGISLEELENGSITPINNEIRDPDLLESLLRMGGADSFENQIKKRYEGSQDERTIGEIIEQKKRESDQGSARQPQRESFSLDYAQMRQRNENTAEATPKKLFESLKKRFSGIPDQECAQLAKAIFMDLKEG